jgi:hypothetical protein
LVGIGREQAAFRFAAKELALEPLVLPLQLDVLRLQGLLALQQDNNVGLAQPRGPFCERHVWDVSPLVPAAKLNPI